MTQNNTSQRFQPIDLFLQTLLGFIADLKDAQEKLLFAGKVTPGIMGNIDTVRIMTRFLREEKDKRGRLVYESLFGEASFVEAFNVVEACWSKADEAPDEAQRGEDSRWFGSRINETINRLCKICEDLGGRHGRGRDGGKGEPSSDDPQKTINSADVPHLKTEEIGLLSWFSEQYPTLCLVKDYTELDHKTRNKYAKKLADFGLLERPEGKTQGYFLSEKGRQYVAEYYS